MSMTLTGVRATFGRFIQQLTATRAGRTQQRNGPAPAHFGAVRTPKSSQSAQEASDQFRGALTATERDTGARLLMEVEAAFERLPQLRTAEWTTDFDRFKREWASLRAGEPKYLRTHQDPAVPEKRRQDSLLGEIKILHESVKGLEMKHDLPQLKNVQANATKTLADIDGMPAGMHGGAYDKLGLTVELLGHWHAQMHSLTNVDVVSQGEKLRDLTRQTEKALELLRTTAGEPGSAKEIAESAAEDVERAADSAYKLGLEAVGKNYVQLKPTQLTNGQQRIKFVNKLKDLDARCDRLTNAPRASEGIRSRASELRSDIDSLISETDKEIRWDNKNAQLREVSPFHRAKLNALKARVRAIKADLAKEIKEIQVQERTSPDQLDPVRFPLTEDVPILNAETIKPLEAARQPCTIAADLDQCLNRLIINTFGLEGGDRNAPPHAASDRSVPSTDVGWPAILRGLGRRDICDGLREANEKLSPGKDPVGSLAAHLKGGEPNDASKAIRNWEAALDEFADRYKGKTGNSAEEVTKWIRVAGSHISQLKARASAEVRPG